MLGRKTFTQEELDHATAAVDEQLTAFRALTKPSEDFAAVYFNSAVLALDRRFVHRVRAVAGKDGNPLNEVELIAEGVMDGGVLPASTVLKLKPDETVLGLDAGDEIALGAADFERLANAFLAEIQARFVVG